jgi:hypothetical protein
MGAMPVRAHDEGNERRGRVVYVIDLDPAACEDRRAPCDGNCPRKPIYVGETGLDPAERFARHKAGKKASRWVRRYGLRVNETLASHLGEFTSSTESEAAEQALAAELYERGYCVRVGPIRENPPG